MKTKILLLTQMHKRPRISELFCMSALRLCEASEKQYDIRIASMVSDNESEEVCKRYGINIIRTVASPLGTKMNEGMTAALSIWNWDYLLQISDDDVVDSNLMKYYAPLIRAGASYFGVKELYFFDLFTWRAMKFRYNNKTDKLVGCGRMFSREAFERTGMRCQVRSLTSFQHLGVKAQPGETLNLPAYQAAYLQAMNKVNIMNEQQFMLYDPAQTRGLDNESEMNMLFNGYHPVVVETPSPMFTDVKSTVNLWSYDQYLQNGKRCEPAEALSFWSNEEIEYLKSLKL